ncbi:unnamed protein product [Fusarium graminearum]|nr:unnamed protein product [Fusarium graminearum]CAG1980348.1 unnamed protein product [Fusarium graminearum]VTO87947.1 unnamed protein product [Fusarium graminearum]
MTGTTQSCHPSPLRTTPTASTTTNRLITSASSPSRRATTCQCYITPQKTNSSIGEHGRQQETGQVKLLSGVVGWLRGWKGDWKGQQRLRRTPAFDTRQRRLRSTKSATMDYHYQGQVDNHQV